MEPHKKIKKKKYSLNNLHRNLNVTLFCQFDHVVKLRNKTIAGKNSSKILSIWDMGLK